MSNLRMAMFTPSSTVKPNRRILVVDDLEAIHVDFRKILASHDPQMQQLQQLEDRLFGASANPVLRETFEIDSAYQGEESLARVKGALAEGRPYAMAFIDVRMPPGWDGIETTDRLWQVDPDLQIVLCTAYSDYSWEEMPARMRASDRLVILKKPFDPIEVIQLASAFTEKWRLAQLTKQWVQALESTVQARTAELRQEVVERERAEAELRESQARLMTQERFAAIGQISDGVAHHFNNILAVIQGHASMLMLNPSRFGPEVQNSLIAISRSVDRAADITRKLLNFTGQTRLPETAVQVEQVLEACKETLTKILGDNISLRLNRAPELPAIRADHQLIEQILTHLALNARDVMPKGGEFIIDITAGSMHAPGTMPDPGAAADAVCLSVRDTGSGIGPDHLSRIFEPFFTTKPIGTHLGLGLATVYGIVQQHGGRIDVDSKTGEGTTFRILFPVTDPNPAVRWLSHSDL